ncbi:hypothetical protein [Pleionea sp. CnH1-48]|uniref:hypothetical protein n=1 Tax=Pleionea sp. CnH1-48 TaxID=2954494 RepID=UPI002096A094|nr:hypothetical protein [Pleionea sp. CnH1-48]MCO7227128.1 hypothetical protein [Pleionea sp. CnH1-48]
MKNVIGTLTLALKANSAQLVTALKKGQDRIKEFSKQAGRYLKKARKHFNSVAKGFAALGAAGVAGLTALYNKQADTIDQLAKFADQLGVSTESLMGLRHAAALTGTDTGVLDRSLVKLQANIGQAAQGVGAAVRNFDKLGLQAKDLAKLGADEQFKAVADAMQKVESQTERNTITFEIFGQKGSALLNTMKGGAQALTAAQEEAKKLGITLNRLDAAKVEAANDAMWRASQVTEGFGNKITVALAPYVDDLATRFFNTAKESGNFANVASRGLKVVFDGVELLAKSLHGLSLLWSSLKVAANDALKGMLEGIADSIKWINSALDTDIGTGFLDGMVESFDIQSKQLNEDLQEKLLNPLDEQFVTWTEEVARKSTEKAKLVADAALDELSKQNPYAVSAVQLEEGESNKDNKEDDKKGACGDGCDDQKRNECFNKEKGFLDRLAALKIKNSKKIFLAQKAIKLKEAIVTGFQGIQLAASSAPPPLNIPFIAMATAEMAANIAGIKGQRANGGPVGSNQSYLVGERGPELFTPTTSGNITSHEALKASRPVSGDKTLNFNINATDANGVEELLINNRALIHHLVSEAMAEEGTAL